MNAARRRTLGALSAAVVVTTSAGAWAQTHDSAAAEALFEEARGLAEAGRFAEACPKFAESQRLDPGVGTLLYLGACYERQGKTASAWAAFREARDGAVVQNRADRVKIASERIAALEPRLPRLRIDVPPAAAVPGLVVLRDEIALGSASWGAFVPIDPGTHVITARAPGRGDWQTTLSANEGAPLEITVPVLTADPRAASGGAASEERSSSHDDGSARRVGAGIVWGLGGASLVAGATFGAVAASQWSDAKEHCRGESAPLQCDQTGLDAIDASKSAGLASTLFFTVGAAAAVGGAVLWFTAPDGKGDEPSAALVVGPGVVRAMGSF